MTTLVLPGGAQLGRRRLFVMLPNPQSEILSSLPADRSTVLLSRPLNRERTSSGSLVSVNVIHLREAFEWLTANVPHIFGRIRWEEPNVTPMAAFDESESPSGILWTWINESAPIPEADEVDWEFRIGCDTVHETPPSGVLPWIEGRPVSATSQLGIEERVFFYLYTNGQHGFVCPRREIRIPFREYCHARLLWRDPRFRQDPQWILWAEAEQTRQSVLDAVNLYLRARHRPSDSRVSYLPTAGEILQHTAQWAAAGAENIHTQSQRSMFREVTWLQNFGLAPHMHSVIGSDPFWTSARQELEAQCRSLGPNCIYMTLNPPRPVEWPEFFVSVDPVSFPNVNAVRSASTTELANFVERHPVEWVLYYEERFREILGLLIDPNGGIFENGVYVVDYYYVVEEQERGYLHIHMLLWLSYAPDLTTVAGRRAFPQ